MEPVRWTSREALVYTGREKQRWRIFLTILTLRAAIVRTAEPRVLPAAWSQDPHGAPRSQAGPHGVD